MTKEALKAKFATGKKPTGEDFAELIEEITGSQGPVGPAGATGVGVKSLALTVNETGAVTGGTLTLTDESTSAITVTTA